MTEISDVIFTSDTFGNMNVWDLKSGTTLMTYKSTSINARCMDILNNDYVLAVQKNPLILAWPINSQEKVQNIRMLCPGVINCFSVSADGLFIAVSIESKLMIWQIATGKLISTVSGHYQHITVIKWTHDGSDIVTGGEDGLVCVWKLSHLISANFMYMGIKSDDTCNSQIEPRFTLADHSIRVNDLYIGSGGHRARLFTASADKTCKVYDLATGSQLLSLVLDTKPCSIAVDATENFVYLGTSDGSIKTFSLLDPPRSRDFHFRDTSNETSFVGHTKSVNCLALSMDGTSLVSGSADESVKIWHVESKQCLRTIRARGGITNLIVRTLPKQLQQHDFQPNTVLKNFQKRYDDITLQEMEILTPVDMMLQDYPSIDETGSDSDIADLHEKIQKLERINHELYHFALNKVLCNREPQVTKSTNFNKNKNISIQPPSETKKKNQGKKRKQNHRFVVDK